MFFSMVPHLLNPKLVSISDFHFTSKLKTVQMKLMKASSKTSACLPYLLVSPGWLSGDLNRLSSLLQRQLPSFTQCTHVISIWGGWGSGLWWWREHHDFDDQTLQQAMIMWALLRDVVFHTSLGQIMEMFTYHWHIARLLPLLTETLYLPMAPLENIYIIFSILYS